MGSLTHAVERLFDKRVWSVMLAVLAAGCGSTRLGGYEREPAVYAGESRSYVEVATTGRIAGPETAASWAPLRTFTFDYDDASIRAGDLAKVAEISDFVRRDPALRIGIDGSLHPRGIDAHNSGLRDRRVEVVRLALVAAGLPPYIIETGPFGNERSMRDRSVEVLVRTSE